MFASPPSQGLEGLDVLYVVGGLYGNLFALERVRQWPADSDAHQSYFDRIRLGPAYRPSDAIRIEE